MVVRVLMMIMFVSVLVGCASTRQPSEMSRLQITVAQLEKKIEDKDQEIIDLKDQVQELSSQVDNMNMPDGNESSGQVINSSSSASSGSVKMDSDRIIRVSATAFEVQRALKGAGYYDGAVDGKIGARSQKAIADFQSDHGLKSDGIVGKKTWIELKKYLQ